MKILCIGDPHFKRDNSIETDILFREVEKTLKKEDYYATVVLGDTLDTFRKVDIDVLTRSIKFLRMITTHCQELFILIGNHDRVNQIDFLSDVSPFYALKFWDHTHVIDSPLLFEKDGCKMLFVPYVYPGRFQESIQQYLEEMSNISLVFSHQEFKGASFNSILSDAEEYPPSFPLNISGHIHSYQCIGKNLIYAGTPYQQNFGDYSTKYLLSVEILQQSKIIVNPLEINYITKKTVSITDTQLRDYIPSTNEEERIKLIISGNPKKIKRVLSLKKFNEIIYTIVISDNFNHFPKSQEDFSSVEIKTTTFREKLIEKVKDIPRMKKLLIALEDD